jgi:UDP-N-acetylmuramate-alanine ligase
MRLGWAPAIDDAVAIVASWARAGDTVLTLGAGDVDAAGPRLLEVLA